MVGTADTPVKVLDRNLPHTRKRPDMALYRGPGSPGGGLRLRGDAVADFHAYTYLRDNPAGLHRELWFHEQGDRSWLVVTRNTITHEITAVDLARDVARAEGRSR